MSRFPGDLEGQAIREPKRWTRTEPGKRGFDHVRLLHGQLRVVEQHLDSGNELCRGSLMHCVQHPDGFREHQVRNPGPTCDELLGRVNLL